MVQKSQQDGGESAAAMYDALAGSCTQHGLRGCMLQCSDCIQFFVVLARLAVISTMKVGLGTPMTSVTFWH